MVGERAVEITQLAAVAMAGNMCVDDLAQVPLWYPTYAGVLGRVAAVATRQLNLNLDWQGEQRGRRGMTPPHFRIEKTTIPLLPTGIDQP